ncbi:MAG: DNA/RNA non-specific endonuclease, partial [Pseudomonadota bacterium]
NGLPVLPYTHFSVVQSEAMGFARLVAWNIDGGSIKRVSTNGVRFRLDPRVERDAQTGNELYKNNTLDRGHIARRADLCWGSVEEARQANYDSYYYTNIAPQHEAYNQSSKGGIWGRLENKVFEDVDVANLRLSVMAGPIFTDADPVYRDTPIPRSFWKVLVYQDAADGALNIRAFVLTQQDLLNDLEALGLEMFQTYEVSLDRLFDLTELDFSAITDLGSDGGSRQSLEGAASLMVPPATRLRTSTTIRAIDREEEHSRLF